MLDDDSVAGFKNRGNLRHALIVDLHLKSLLGEVLGLQKTARTLSPVTFTPVKNEDAFESSCIVTIDSFLRIVRKYKLGPIVLGMCEKDIIVVRLDGNTRAMFLPLLLHCVRQSHLLVFGRCFFGIMFVRHSIVPRKEIDVFAKDFIPAHGNTGGRGSSAHGVVASL